MYHKRFLQNLILSDDNIILYDLEDILKLEYLG